MPSRRKELVRYCSPFGSPAWMERERAEEYLAADDARWLEWQELKMLTPTQLQHGPPYIQTAQQRLGERGLARTRVR